MKLWARRAAATLAVGYFAALVVVLVLLRFVGESFWMTAFALYLPRVGFAFPLPFVVIALWLFGPRRLLWSQLAAALIVLFPLMGFVMNLPVGNKQPSLRLMSFNVNSAYSGVDTVVNAIVQHAPDIVVIQEVSANGDLLQSSLATHFPTVQSSTQFIIATKFPITATVEPDKLPHDGRLRSPRFILYSVKTPLGDIALYNVHPISPRFGLYSLRGSGLRKEILSGRFFRGERAGGLLADTALRAEQAMAFGAMAAKERGSVIIAGDTNLPSLSPVLARALEPFVDGFPSVGEGLGYTFPAKHPWMRIDRILTSHDLRLSSFTVDCDGASDHLCIVADVQKR
ncbi:MAG TPA: endonuclease/exonuclease/phosphatase family protein [Polyangiaceae bacterium]|jgi:vancomycin resistance protein VanJ|nr:endonuclease/exonuclease/phosphatase family protein [Polyangiaceae bacterium]